MQHEHSPPPAHSQSGNALFLILIAVALFAALAYAITSSSRGGGGVTREQAVLLAAQITQQGAALQNIVTRMILTGTAGEDLDFCDGADLDCSFASGAAGTPCTSGSDCVFAAEGGGALVPEIPATAINPVSAGAGIDGWSFMVDTYFTGVGSDETDVIAYACGLTQTVCENINKGLGEVTTPPAHDGLALAFFCFAPQGTSGAVDLPTICPGCVDKPALCVSTGALHVYYHFLAER